ncbi:MAG: T9SS type A sorting domain-containing protein [Bacteroidota bacterium]|nr:T9SS type A sorting domain-containing protein [Bacteroidota bacterium]
MKKQVLLQLFIGLLFFFTSSNGKAQVATRISIANGNWNNPAIWNPAGVPMPGDDSIIINTAVTYNQNIVDGQAMFRVNSGASLTDTGNDTATFGGDRFVINGYFSCYVLAIGMGDSATVNGIMYVTSDVAQSGTFIVQPAGQICVAQQLATSDDFINNGSVSTANWLNGAAVTGNQGKFCVANYFINSDNISGNIDICDATPNTIYDVNAGTISGSVTYCAAGPCGTCPSPNGIAQADLNENSIKVFPNPFSSFTQIETDPALLHIYNDLQFVLYDVNGKIVRKEKMTNTVMRVERGDLPDGIYFYRVFAGENALATGKLCVLQAN